MIKRNFPYSDKEIAQIMGIKKEEFRFFPRRRMLKEAISDFNMRSDRGSFINTLEEIRASLRGEEPCFQSEMQSLINYARLAL